MNINGYDIKPCANLIGAYLTDANLTDANLTNANLTDADLTGAKGIILLPVQDPRGHSFAHAINTKKEWRIRVGCRDFSIDEALKHWGKEYTNNREIGDAYIHAVEWLILKLANKTETRGE